MYLIPPIDAVETINTCEGLVPAFETIRFMTRNSCSGCSARLHDPLERVLESDGGCHELCEHWIWHLEVHCHGRQFADEACRVNSGMDGPRTVGRSSPDGRLID